MGILRNGILCIGLCLVVRTPAGVLDISVRRLRIIMIYLSTTGKY
jgi:hypothetical protein